MPGNRVFGHVFSWPDKYFSVFSLFVAAASFLVSCVALGMAAWSLLVEHKARKEEAIVRAWSLIAAAPGVEGNIGLVPALELLHSEGRSLKRVRLHGAYLENLSLQGANLQYSEFQAPIGAQVNQSDLRDVNFNHACMLGIELQNTHLEGANLRSADLRWALLKGIRLDGADLWHADLRNVSGLTCRELKKAENWQMVYRDPVLACGEEIPGTSWDINAGCNFGRQ